MTIRSRPGSSGANAICVESPEPVCTALISESGAIDGYEEYGAAGFELDDTAIGVAWVSNDLEIVHNDQTRRPADFTGASLRPSELLNPADGYIDGTTATIIANNRTERGRFVIVDIPTRERPPTIRLLADGADPNDTNIEDEFDLTPTTAGAFSF